VDVAGNESGDSLTQNVTIHTIGPRVTGITAALEAVRVTFDEDLDPGTVTPASFKVFGPNGTALDGAVSYDAGTDVATFTPTAAWPAGVNRIWLDGTSSVTDTAGSRLDGENPGSEPGLPSGDGQAGGDFEAKFAVVLLGRGGIASKDYTDEDGDVFSLGYAGAGSATVIFNAIPLTATGADMNSITFGAAATSTRLANELVETNGDGATTLRTISAPSQSLKALDLAATTVLGNVNIGGRITSLIVGGDLGTAASTVVLDSVRELEVGGDFNAVLRASRGVGDVTVVGEISDLAALYSGLGVDFQPGTPDDVTRTSQARMGRIQANTIGGILWSSTDIASVQSTQGDITATITALLDLKSVFSADEIASADGLNAGRDIGTVEARGKLSADVIAGRNIKAVIAASMDPEIRAQNGKITDVRTTQGDLEAFIFAARGITRVESAGNLNGEIMSGLGIGTVSAQQAIQGFIAAEGGAVKAVVAGGQFSGEVRATGNVTRVQADAINDARILAGSDGSRGRDVGTVNAVNGGILDSDIRATRNVKTVTAGQQGIQNTQIRAGVYAGADGDFGTADDQAYAGGITAVSTPGALADTLILAGVNPGLDGEYGKHPDSPGQATDNNPKSTSASVRRVTVGQQYLGDVRIIVGSKTIGTYTIGGTRRTASEASPDAVTGPNFLTLIRSVRRPDGQYVSEVVMPS